jgi:hypothetical protein
MFKTNVCFKAKILAMTTLFSSFSLHAATFFEMDTTLPLKCTLSSLYHNRVMIEGGRIKKVVGACDQLQYTLENESGQLFIQALHPNPRSATVSVITQEGTVQDLEINFEKKSSEVVVLRDPQPIEEQVKETLPEERPFECFEPCVFGIDEILMGKIPQGYTTCPIEVASQKLKSGILLEAKTKIEGPSEVIYIYDITNISPRKKCLFEKEMSFEGARWVYLTKNTLKPKEKIIGIVSIGK